ncbi:hypothetical protein [Enterococcus faecium]|uniref:hypothetical protein n=1 Tax=Enterococcus faecium TaxID=1352 RepID=UPI001883C292|nr:hypothetical protein [Enterococcus faecium]MBE9862364.1 hypothetical protein [Enterococcus faecium]MDV7756623.1 hypothetical protein [Enterococcus faecium]
MKKKKLLWICLAILLIIGGIETFTTYRLKTNQTKQYVSDMLHVIEEIDSEMKILSKNFMDLGERYDFKGFMEDKMDEVSSREIPEGIPKAVRDTKDTLLEAIDKVNTALLTNDVKLLEQGQLCFSMAQAIYIEFLDGNIKEKPLNEKLNSFVETYTTIPPTWKLVNEDKGITINTDTEISTDAQSLSDLLANLTGISNAVIEQVGKDIPLRLLENGKKDYSVVFKNGQVTDYNEVFKKVIE